jgi:Zn-dependent M28 family amino/carboxypeptidase
MSRARSRFGRVWSVGVTAVCGLAAVAAVVAAQAPRAATPAISADRIVAHVKVLASDAFEGRAPGTRGEDRTVAYISEQFAKEGLQPGNPDGTFVQNVPMVGITASPSSTFVFNKGAETRTLRFKDDVVAWTKRVRPSVSVRDSDVVFVGYGIQAPEFQWDDYKGLDVAGKTVIMLVNDPPIPDPADATKLDPKTFGGRAMTYYGRWTYKYEIGAEKKAAAVLIVHETGPAAYPFSVVQSKVTEQVDAAAADDNMSRAAIEGWITLDQAKALFAMGGQDFDVLKARAATRAFAPVDLGLKASMTIPNTIRTFASRNVIGKFPGADPKLKDEYIIYTAHWDHYGIGPEINGDKIYNGALDNATGVAGLFELARAFANEPVKPKRSILFMAVTAEEQGLVGSDYYAKNPFYPLAKTLAVINMDALGIYGRTRDLTVSGLGNSQLDDYAREAAAEQGRVLKPDPTPEFGGYFRSDHFSFAKQGVPAINAGGGADPIGMTAEALRKLQQDFVANNYHKPSDEYRPTWDLSGGVQDLQIYFLMGHRIAQADTFPQWSATSEFKARRDKMMGK